jgi:hypothetical protein
MAQIGPFVYKEFSFEFPRASNGSHFEWWALYLPLTTILLVKLHVKPFCEALGALTTKQFIFQLI